MCCAMQAAGGWPGSPTAADSSSRAMQRLKDMYARNASVHERDRATQPQGVKQLLQVSLNTLPCYAGQLLIPDVLSAVTVFNFCC